jgi:hypothetical protein
MGLYNRVLSTESKDSSAHTASTHSAAAEDEKKKPSTSFWPNEPPQRHLTSAKRYEASSTLSRSWITPSKHRFAYSGSLPTVCR